MNGPLRAADWAFREIIVDDNPPQPSRITDCTIVDINGYGKPDIAGKNYDIDKQFFTWYLFMS